MAQGKKIIKSYRVGKNHRAEKKKERTSLPFSVQRGTIDSSVMSVVLAAVQRD